MISSLKKSENPSPQGQQEFRAVQAFVRRENPQAGYVLFAGAQYFPLASGRNPLLRKGMGKLEYKEGPHADCQLFYAFQGPMAIGGKGHKGERG